MPKKKPYVIIRRSGYYVTSIVNEDDIIQLWKLNNVPRANIKVKPDSDGLRPMLPLNKAVRANMLSFAPATEAEVRQAPLYAAEYKLKYGLLRG